MLTISMIQEAFSNPIGHSPRTGDDAHLLCILGAITTTLWSLVRIVFLENFLLVTFVVTLWRRSPGMVPIHKAPEKAGP